MGERHLGVRLENIGLAMLRYGLAALLLMIGAMKWTSAEAEAIRPWVAGSPVLSWIDSVASVEHASEAIGAFEIVVALLIGVRRWLPRAALAGSLAAAAMFVVTLSFLVKDFFLLAAALWSAGEALEASAGRNAAEAGR